MGPGGRAEKARETEPRLGSDGFGMPVAVRPRLGGQTRFLLKVFPATMVEADGWPAGKTRTVGVYWVPAASPGTVTVAAAVGPIT